MKTAVAVRARELGFDACRCTTAEPPASAPRFKRWLAGHQHGEMAYLQRNARQRVDPCQVLPGAKSIICVAASYEIAGLQAAGRRFQRGVPDESSLNSGPAATTSRITSHGTDTTPRCALRTPHFGVIARYARYCDYHEVLGERLKALRDFVDLLGGAGTRSLWYVDTGPLLERDLAQRAGLGFIGKHTNLISRTLGNWIFLGEIITTLTLEPDPPEKNRCGTCARCVTACPTRAITAPFQLDARLCISYLTIELKGPIPAELRPAIGNRIFGCDDCLAVCPWNRFAQEGKLMRDRARADLDEPELIELLGLDDAGFKRRFADTPIWRAKRRGFLRNVCVALGNIGGASALPALHRATGDAEALIAEHARWAIEQIVSRGRRIEVGVATTAPAQ